MHPVPLVALSQGMPRLPQTPGDSPHLGYGIKGEALPPAEDMISDHTAPKNDRENGVAKYICFKAPGQSHFIRGSVRGLGKCSINIPGVESAIKSRLEAVCRFSIDVIIVSKNDLVKVLRYR